MKLFSVLLLFILFSQSNFLSTSRKTTALLVSVEDTDLTYKYDNNATQDGDLYIENFEEVLEDRGFDNIEKMYNPTGKSFLESLSKHISTLDKDDLFVFYFYGHGGQIFDTSGDEIGMDNNDETLVLKDREVLDDEIYTILNSHSSNAKVIIIIEACNSGSSIKFFKPQKKLPYLHKTLKEKRKKPNLDIIYIGSTTDGRLMPSDTFNEILITTISDKKNDNYYEFSESLKEKMFSQYDIIPTIDFDWASKSFLESQPFK